MIKVCIIEDEPEIRKLLRMIVEKQEGFTVVSENGDFASAVSDFAKYRPDVAFVDIDLKGESGLECAKVLTELNPKLKVIFATAHSEYMANAFEIYAFDYLVKPFNVERVVKTLSRIKNKTEEETSATVIQSEKHSDKLMIKGKEQIVFVDKKDIIFIERSDNATSIVTEEENYKTSVSLGAIEEKLNTAEFMRCHKSYIINISRISKIEPYGRWTYIVKFKGTSETALMTAQNYEEIKKIFG
ncbi:MAG: response regulator transcription factor [Lachnospiraceae bacterium]|nr:response regulator transcription factor [Lachnospiraceae bacterium]